MPDSASRNPLRGAVSRAAEPLTASRLTNNCTGIVALVYDGVSSSCEIDLVIMPCDFTLPGAENPGLALYSQLRQAPESRRA